MDEPKLLDNAIRLIDLTQRISPLEYLKSNLPGPVDEEILAICTSVMESSSVERTDFVSLLEADAHYVLHNFGYRMAMLSVRVNSYQYLLKGLVALILAATKSDYENVLMTLSLFYRSAEKLNVAPEKLFAEASQYAPSEPVAEFILGYLQRSPENRRIEIIGFKEVDGPAGLIYQFANLPIPKGFL